jgi:hypothetical protein
MASGRKWRVNHTGNNRLPRLQQGLHRPSRLSGADAVPRRAAERHFAERHFVSFLQSLSFVDLWPML